MTGQEPRHDPPRDRLRRALWKNATSLAEASLAIGRNKAYLHQYFSRRMPRVLSHQDSEALGRLLGCDPKDFRHDTLPAPKPWKRKAAPAAARPALTPEHDFAAIPEVDVEASAGPGALAGEYVAEKARWALPETMIRHEGAADPGALRILGVRGNSMEPVLSDGDRVVVDTARRQPATGEMFVLWDGIGLVVKRVASLSRDGWLSLISANPEYPPYECRADEVHIAGKVVWMVVRA